MAETITTLAWKELVPWPGINPRRSFDVAELEELRDTIRQEGLLQPVGVKLNPKPPHFIFAGERRWRASEGVLEEVPVVVRDITEATAFRLALMENIQRRDLTAIEEAWGIRRYMDAQPELTQKDVAEELGRSQPWVANRLRLLDLPEWAQELIVEGRLPASLAKDLLLPLFAVRQDLQHVISEALEEELLALHGPITEEAILGAARRALIPISRWTDSPAWGAEKEQNVGTLYRLDPADLPKDTLVTFLWHYGHRSARCFDLELWRERMAEQIAAEKKRREENAAKVTEEEEEEVDPLADVAEGQELEVESLWNGDDLSDRVVAVLKNGALMWAVRRGDLSPWGEKLRFGYDVRQIPPECLRVVLDKESGERALCYRGSLEELEALEAAQEKELDEELRKAVRKRYEEDAPDVPFATSARDIFAAGLDGAELLAELTHLGIIDTPGFAGGVDATRHRLLEADVNRVEVAAMAMCNRMRNGGPAHVWREVREQLFTGRAQHVEAHLLKHWPQLLEEEPGDEDAAGE